MIPVFNGANYLRQAIESALAQTYSQREVLIINDGSTDGGATEAIARGFGDAVRYISKTNGGVATALNEGIRQMRGEYFSWLSHDDVYYEHKLARQVECLATLAPTDVLYGDYDIIDRESTKTGTCVGPHPAPDPFRVAMIATYPVHGCTTLVHRNCFELAGMFDESLRTTQDNDMWFRLAGRFRMVHMPVPLIQSREHEQQGCRTISTRFSDADLLHIGFLKQVTTDELIRWSPEHSVACAYARLATALRDSKKFLAAAEFAGQLCRLAIRQESFRNRWRARLAWWRYRFSGSRAAGFGRRVKKGLGFRIGKVLGPRERTGP